MNILKLDEGAKLLQTVCKSRGRLLEWPARVARNGEAGLFGARSMEESPFHGATPRLQPVLAGPLALWRAERLEWAHKHLFADSLSATKTAPWRAGEQPSATELANSMNSSLVVCDPTRLAAERKLPSERASKAPHLAQCAILAKPKPKPRFEYGGTSHLDATKRQFNSPISIQPFSSPLPQLSPSATLSAAKR